MAKKQEQLQKGRVSVVTRACQLQKSQLIAEVKFIAYFSLANFKHKSGLEFKLATMFPK